MTSAPARPRRLAAALVALAVGACSPTATSAPDPPTTTVPTTVPFAAEGLAPETSAELARLVDVTERLRGLTFTRPPTITVVSDGELEERVRALIDEDADTVAVDAALYTLLGLLPAGTDLAALYRDLYGEQVAGFYDGETGELVIPADTAALSPLEEATLVHELTHALVDDRFGVWDRYEELVDGDRFDEAGAVLALLEGDATLTQLVYISGLPPAEQQEALRESFAADTATFDAAPRFIQGSILFPYESGLAFAEALHREGGFAALDEVYGAPPVSTEQVLTPADYPADVPVAVTPPAGSPAGYEEATTSVWGELGFRLLFDQTLGGRPEAAAGWAGDAYTVWTGGPEVALALVAEMETPADAAELAGALVEHVAGAMALAPDPDDPSLFVGDDLAVVVADGTRVVFLAASDPAVADELRAAAG